MNAKRFAEPVPLCTASRRLAGRLSVVLALSWLAGALTACDPGQQGPQQTATAGSIAAETLEPTNLERWADDTFGQLLEEHRISALAISVTHGDEVVFKKGYGRHDYVTMRPVDPDVSQFRIGSLTKTFFGTAIAQLLERGEIVSLDDPVNDYLTRIQVENPFGDDEITIRDMVTHQGGMASRGSRSIFTSVGEERPQPPLSAAALEANLPPVVRVPGTLSQYCNACSAVMGFMVEDITGLTLEEYLQENVYEPLGMTHTTLVNSLEAPSPDVVTQYSFVSGEPPVALRYPSLTPFISYAGDVNSTAGDMARFIRAHALEGGGGTPALMEPETYEIMHRWDRGNHPDASGFGIQFFRYDYNGEPVIEHYGSIRYRSLEIIMLDEQVGIFVTMAGGSDPDPDDVAGTDSSLEPIAGPVLEQASHSGVRAIILEHFLGRLPVDESLEVDVSQYTGLYHGIPTTQADTPGGGGRLVEDSGDGGLIIDGLGPYRPSGPHAFTLDGQLPVEAGFRDSNRYVFAPQRDGSVRMFAHINAGGFVRTARE
jgi:CubicO group peptidase (beta-lactamase class C family)